jgi:hypothetical protein
MCVVSKRVVFETDLMLSDKCVVEMFFVYIQNYIQKTKASTKLALLPR